MYSKALLDSTRSFEEHQLAKVKEKSLVVGVAATGIDQKSSELPSIEDRWDPLENNSLKEDDTDDDDWDDDNFGSDGNVSDDPFADDIESTTGTKQRSGMFFVFSEVCFS